MIKYQKLLYDHKNDLAEIISLENGKTLNDAHGDVFRGIEVVEHCASFGSLL